MDGSCTRFRALRSVWECSVPNATQSCHRAVTQPLRAGLMNAAASRFCDARRSLLLFVVMQCLPEADPDIEQAQAAAHAAEKAIRNYAAERGKRQQQIIVGPL